MSSDLVTFVRARLDEDESAAKACAAREGATWSPSDERLGESVHNEETGATVAMGSFGYMPWETRRHIARHDPARVLREVEAKRRLLAIDESDPCKAEYNNDKVSGWLDAQHQVLQLLALPYADHPSYRAEWAP